MNHVFEDIFERLKAGEVMPFKDPQYPRILEAVSRTMKLVALMNASADINQIREILGDIIGDKVDASTFVLVPFHTNFGRFIQIGKNVFINHACTFLAMGGITIEDNVLIGPKVNLITENHPADPANR